MSLNIGCSVGPLGLLTIAFIILKLTGYFTWAWPWIFAPVWVPIALLCIGNFVCWAALKLRLI